MMTAILQYGGFFYARKQINRRFELENIYITAHDGQVG